MGPKVSRSALASLKVRRVEGRRGGAGRGRALFRASGAALCLPPRARSVRGGTRALRRVDGFRARGCRFVGAARRG